MAGLLIGDVAGRVGVAPATIRYYESIGVLAPPTRSIAGYRRYNNTTIEELRFIKKAQALGFSLDELRDILGLSRAGRIPCARVLELARRHLDGVDERIRQLTRFRDQLARAIAKWDRRQEATCAGLCQLITTVDEIPEENRREIPRRRLTRFSKR